VTFRIFKACLCLWFATLAACVVEDPNADTADGGDAGTSDKCEAGTDCGSDKICPAGGPFKSKCSVPCTVNNDCTLRAGNGQYCLNGVCTTVCGDTCNIGFQISNCGSKLRCVSQRQIDGNPSTCEVGWCIP
jgi:hypothetical protein